MRRLILGLVLLAFVAAAPQAQEQAVLTTPVVTSTTTTSYQILSVFVQRATMGYDWMITIRYLDSQGNELSDAHVGAEAAPLVKTVNNNTTGKSVEKLALQHLIAERRIPAASITGVPQ